MEYAKYRPSPLTSEGNADTEGEEQEVEHSTLTVLDTDPSSNITMTPWKDADAKHDLELADPVAQGFLEALRRRLQRSRALPPIGDPPLRKVSSSKLSFASVSELQEILQCGDITEDPDVEDKSKLDSTEASDPEALPGGGAGIKLPPTVAPPRHLPASYSSLASSTGSPATSGLWMSCARRHSSLRTDDGPCDVNSNVTDCDEGQFDVNSAEVFNDGSTQYKDPSRRTRKLSLVLTDRSPAPSTTLRRTHSLPQEPGLQFKRDLDPICNDLDPDLLKACRSTYPLGTSDLQALRGPSQATPEGLSTYSRELQSRKKSEVGETGGRVSRQHRQQQRVRKVSSHSQPCFSQSRVTCVDIPHLAGGEAFGSPSDAQGLASQVFQQSNVVFRDHRNTTQQPSQLQDDQEATCARELGHASSSSSSSLGSVDDPEIVEEPAGRDMRILQWLRDCDSAHDGGQGHGALPNVPSS